MTRYLSLICFTEKGLHNVKGSVQRAREFRSLVEAAGGKVLSQYWAVGDMDGAVIFEAPDEATGAALLLKLADQGFVRTESLRLFNEKEFSAILDRV